MIRELRLLIVTYLIAWAFDIAPQDSEIKLRLAVLAKKWSGDGAARRGRDDQAR